MSESKHTPKPWTTDGINIFGPSFDQIAKAEADPSVCEDCCVANANLIAAAPELLKALEDMLLVVDCADETGYVDGFGFVDIEAVKQAASAAIAKATGKEKL